MANNELNRSEHGKSESGWDELGRGPEDAAEQAAERSESEITNNDVEYFKSNPKELSDLVAELVQLRGGSDAIKEGATWDKDKRAYVDANGVPRDWSHLVGYLKQNPDAIGGVLQEYNDLRNAADEKAANRERLKELVKKYPRLPGEKTSDWKARIDAAEGANTADVVDEAEPTEEIPIPEEVEGIEPEDIAAEGGGMEMPYTEAVEQVETTEEAAAENSEADGAESGEGPEAEATPVESEEKADTEAAPDNVIEFPGPKAPEKKPVSFEDQMASLEERFKEITKMQEQSAVWEALNRTLGACPPGVQAQVKYLRQQENVAMGQAFLDERRAALKKMPFITLPWSKKHQEKVTLKQIIASSERSLAYNTDQLNKLEEGLPESLSESEQSQVDALRGFDAKMARLNDDLHTRGLEGDIKMRQKWIEQQEKLLQTDTKNMINAVPEKTRLDAIEKWKQEIVEIEGRIAKYQAEHPDFEMHPKEKVPDEELEAAA